MSDFSEKKAFRLAAHCQTTFRVLSCLLLCVSFVSGQTKVPPPPGPAVGDQPVLRFPVAHAHFGSWCLGNLTITPDGVRYDAVQRQKDGLHSFQLNRSELTYVNYWMIGGNWMNAVEVRTASKVYHFWLLQAPADALTVRQARWTPAEAGSADGLVLSLYYWASTGDVPQLQAVNAFLALARATAAANSAAEAPSNDNVAEATRKMNDHMFVNSYGNHVITNSISTINHMSHW